MHDGGCYNRWYIDDVTDEIPDEAYDVEISTSYAHVYNVYWDYTYDEVIELQFNKSLLRVVASTNDGYGDVSMEYVEDYNTDESKNNIGKILASAKNLSITDKKINIKTKFNKHYLITVNGKESNQELQVTDITNYLLNIDYEIDIEWCYAQTYEEKYWNSTTKTIEMIFNNSFLKIACTEKNECSEISILYRKNYTED